MPKLFVITSDVLNRWVRGAEVVLDQIDATLPFGFFLVPFFGSVLFFLDFSFLFLFIF